MSRIPWTKHLLVGAVVAVALVVALAGCDGGQPAAETPVPPTATVAVAFKVELPVTATATPVVVDGVVQPSPTPGPTNTPAPTRTPWPTKAPTSAPADDPNMVYIPGGPFVFGSMDKPEESPRQDAEIDAYNIDKLPVTNADYQAYVTATGVECPATGKTALSLLAKSSIPWCG